MSLPYPSYNLATMRRKTTMRRMSLLQSQTLAASRHAIGCESCGDSVRDRRCTRVDALISSPFHLRSADDSPSRLLQHQTAIRRDKCESKQSTMRIQLQASRPACQWPPTRRYRSLAALVRLCCISHIREFKSKESLVFELSERERNKS
jgi:hypothetical protein